MINNAFKEFQDRNEANFKENLRNMQPPMNEVQYQEMKIEEAIAALIATWNLTVVNYN